MGVPSSVCEMILDLRGGAGFLGLDLVSVRGMVVVYWCRWRVLATWSESEIEPLTTCVEAIQKCDVRSSLVG
eukprot:scaffold931_cov200-Alexandrium_tamarense.AAC.28